MAWEQRLAAERCARGGTARTAVCLAGRVRGVDRVDDGRSQPSPHRRAVRRARTRYVTVRVPVPRAGARGLSRPDRGAGCARLRWHVPPERRRCARRASRQSVRASRPRGRALSRARPPGAALDRFGGHGVARAERRAAAGRAGPDRARRGATVERPLALSTPGACGAGPSTARDPASAASRRRAPRVDRCRAAGPGPAPSLARALRTPSVHPIRRPRSRPRRGDRHRPFSTGIRRARRAIRHARGRARHRRKGPLDSPPPHVERPPRGAAARCDRAPIRTGQATKMREPSRPARGTIGVPEPRCGTHRAPLGPAGARPDGARHPLPAASGGRRRGGIRRRRPRSAPGRQPRHGGPAADRPSSQRGRGPCRRAPRDHAGRRPTVSTHRGGEIHRPFPRAGRRPGRASTRHAAPRAASRRALDRAAKRALRRLRAPQRHARRAPKRRSSVSAAPGGAIDRACAVTRPPRSEPAIPHRLAAPGIRRDRAAAGEPRHDARPAPDGATGLARGRSPPSPPRPERMRPSPPRRNACGRRGPGRRLHP
jgi:hypothetical protein